MSENSGTHNVDSQIGDNNGIVVSGNSLASIKEKLQTNDNSANFEVVNQSTPLDIIGVFDTKFSEDKIRISVENLHATSPKAILSNEEILELKKLSQTEQKKVNRIATEALGIFSSLSSEELRNRATVFKEDHESLVIDEITFEDPEVSTANKELDIWAFSAVQAKIENKNIPDGQNKLDNFNAAVEVEKQNIKKIFAGERRTLYNAVYQAIDSFVDSGLDVSEFDLPNGLLDQYMVSSLKTSFPVAIVASEQWNYIKTNTKLGITSCSAMPGKWTPPIKVEDTTTEQVISSEPYSSTAFINYSILTELLDEWIDFRQALLGDASEGGLYYVGSISHDSPVSPYNQSTRQRSNNLSRTLFSSWQSHWDGDYIGYEDREFIQNEVHQASGLIKNSDAWNHRLIRELIFDSKEQIEINLDLSTSPAQQNPDYYMAIFLLGLSGSKSGSPKYWFYKNADPSAPEPDIKNDYDDSVILNSVNATGSSGLVRKATNGMLADEWIRTKTTSAPAESLEGGGLLRSDIFDSIYKTGLTLIRILRNIFMKTVSNLFNIYQANGLVGSNVGFESFKNSCLNDSEFVGFFRIVLNNLPTLERLSNPNTPRHLWKLDDSSGAFILQYGALYITDPSKGNTPLGQEKKFADAYRNFKLRVSDFETLTLTDTYRDSLGPDFLPEEIYRDYIHKLKSNSQVYNAGQYIERKTWDFIDPLVFKSQDSISENNLNNNGFPSMSAEEYGAILYSRELDSLSNQNLEKYEKINNLSVSEELTGLVKNGVIKLDGFGNKAENWENNTKDLADQMSYDAGTFITKKLTDITKIESLVNLDDELSKIENYDRIVIIGIPHEASGSIQIYGYDSDSSLAQPFDDVVMSVNPDFGSAVYTDGTISELLKSLIYLKYGIDYSIEMFPENIEVLDPIFPTVLTQGNVDNKWPWDDGETEFVDGKPSKSVDPRYYSSSLMFPEWTTNKILATKLYKDIVFCLVKTRTNPQEIRAVLNTEN